MNVQELLKKLNSYKMIDPRDIDVEDLQKTMEMTIRILIILLRENETMGDVLHSIQTAMKLLGRQEE